MNNAGHSSSCALLDYGPEVFFIRKEPFNHSVYWQHELIFQCRARGLGVTTHQVLVDVGSLQSVEMHIHLVLPKLTATFSSARIQRSWSHLTELPLTNPQYNQLARVDVILGADVYDLLIREGTRTDLSDIPSAQLTIFDWVLYPIMDSISDQFTKPNF